MSEIRRYMSLPEQIAENVRLNAMQRERDQTARIAPQKPPTPESATIPRGTKDQEIESIKRTLYNAIDKLNKLTEK